MLVAARLGGLALSAQLVFALPQVEVQASAARSSSTAATGPQPLYPTYDPKPSPPTYSSPPAYSAPPPPPPSYGGACAQAAASQARAAPSATATVPAKLAWDCLQSVSLHTSEDQELLESVRPYVEWQSTLSYLKNPPPGYLEPAADVFGSLDAIKSKLDKAAYSNEYAFEFDLYKVFQQTHDGHFRFLPNLMSIFTFRRPVALVSVSNDGKELPKPYVYADVLQTAGRRSPAFQPSAVTKINGQDALTYLENWSQVGSLQDPDALYNNNFFSLAAISIGSAGTGGGLFAGASRGGYNYAGPETTLTFANGTVKTYENYALIRKNLTGVASGEDLWTKYVNLPTYSPTPAAPTPSKPTPAPGYPSPVMRQINNLIGGYYIDTPGYEDVAVLSIPSFVGDGSAEESFQDIGLNFLKQSVADGKKKLVIDVSINGGGTVHQGYNLFAELFPHLFPYGATRFRTHEAYNILGNFVSNVSGPVYPPYEGPANQTSLDTFSGTPFNYRADVDNDYRPFTSWQEKYGPHEFNGDYFTPILRWNLSDYYAIGLNVSGYGNRSHVVDRTFFKPEDMVIVYDGYCASTCTIFSEFMRQQGKVKAIALGGRSKPGIIQAVGGVKGTNDYLWTDIYAFVNSTFALASPAQRDALSQTVLSKYNTLPFRRGDPTFHAINVRDGLREGDTAQVPLQFRYEAADCRVYYTPQMTVEQSAVWEAAADVTWGGKACAAGSLAPGTPPAIGERSVHDVPRPVGEIDEEGIRMALETWVQGEGYGGNGYMPPV